MMGSWQADSRWLVCLVIIWLLAATIIPVVDQRVISTDQNTLIECQYNIIKDDISSEEEWAKSLRDAEHARAKIGDKEYHLRKIKIFDTRYDDQERIKKETCR